jgi:SAM-dependent methyltransferase
MTTSPPIIFDRPSYRARRERAAKAGETSFLVDMALSAISERVAAVNRRFVNALDLGSHYSASSTLAGLAKSWTHAGPASSFDKWGPTVVTDEETLPFADQSFDLIVSALSLHAVNDLPGALHQICRALKPDGLFMAAMFGGDTLMELRQAFARAETEIRGGVSPRVAPFADIRDLGGLMQRAGFALPVADVERTTVRYSNLMKLFKDLRSMGETNVLAERTSAPLTRSLLGTVISAYADLFEDQERLPASFEIVFLTGWAPHESQQKPLKPGSAKMRLSEALGTEEHSAGEKPG